MTELVVLEGTLLATGVDIGIRRGWKKWYFVLKSNLDYYESAASFAEDEQPVGTIILDAYHVSIPNDSNGFEFQINGYPKSIRLCADNRQSRDKWIYSLQQCVENLPLLDNYSPTQ
ncbi:hypothetical protein WA158_002443 [Blastocystis sp. Blastoise]